MEELELKVSGMHCGGCEKRVKNALELIDGIEEVQADHESGKVVVRTSKKVSLDEIKETIDDLGFSM